MTINNNILNFYDSSYTNTNMLIATREQNC